MISLHELKEKMNPTKHVSKKGDCYCVYNKAGKIVAKFDDKKSADAYAVKNHDKLMESPKKWGPLEIGTDEYSRRYKEMTPGQTNEAWSSPYDNAAVGLGVAGAAAASRPARQRIGKAYSDIFKGKPKKKKPTPVTGPTTPAAKAPSAKTPKKAKPTPAGPVKEPTPEKPTTTTATPTVGKKKKTGGKVAGKVSMTPDAVRKRAARAKQKEKIAKAASPQGKSPMPSPSKYSDLRKKQQATAKGSMYVKGAKKSGASKSAVKTAKSPVTKKPKRFNDLRK